MRPLTLRTLEGKTNMQKTGKARHQCKHSCASSTCWGTLGLCGGRLVANRMKEKRGKQLDGFSTRLGFHFHLCTTRSSPATIRYKKNHDSASGVVQKRLRACVWVCHYARPKQEERPCRLQTAVMVTFFLSLLLIAR